MLPVRALLACLFSVAPLLLCAQQPARAPVYTTNALDEKPHRVSGPPVAYPANLALRHVGGTAVVSVIIDTLGHAEPASIEIQQSPDSGFIEPLKQMVLASQYTPGRLHGLAVRTWTGFSVRLTPPTLDPTALITAARTALGGGHTDSAFGLLRDALDSATQASEGERMYGLLVRGIAWRRVGRDTLAQSDFTRAETLRRDLQARGVPLAPFLVGLADSVRLAPRRPPPLGLTVMDSVDVSPVLVSQPSVHYPPEMRALNVGGTVVVEATLNELGRVATARVVQSPNPGLDAEALRVVRESAYRPAQRRGHAIRTVIRQGIIFITH